jgi:hypothetical protein
VALFSPSWSSSFLRFAGIGENLLLDSILNIIGNFSEFFLKESK